MEALVALAGLALTGYQLNRDVTKEERNAVNPQTVVPSNEKPNTKDMSVKAKEDEQAKADEIFPYRRKIMFGASLEDIQKVVPMTHTNMVPSFSGMNNRYNIRLDNNTRLNELTGKDMYQRPKKELYSTELTETQYPVDREQNIVNNVNDATRQTVKKSLSDSLNNYSLEQQLPIDKAKISRNDMNVNELARQSIDPSKTSLNNKQGFAAPMMLGQRGSMGMTNIGERSYEHVSRTFDVSDRAIGNRADITGKSVVDSLVVVDTQRGQNESMYFGIQSQQIGAYSPIGQQTDYRSKNKYGELPMMTAQRNDYQGSVDREVNYLMKDQRRQQYERSNIVGPGRSIQTMVKQYETGLESTRKDNIVDNEHFGPSAQRVKKDLMSQTKMIIRETTKQLVNTYIAPADASGQHMNRVDQDAVETRETRKFALREILRVGGRDIGYYDNGETTREADRTFNARTSASNQTSNFDPEAIGASTRGIDTSVMNDRLDLNVQQVKHVQETNMFQLDVAKAFV